MKHFLILLESACVVLKKRILSLEKNRCVNGGAVIATLHSDISFTATFAQNKKRYGESRPPCLRPLKSLYNFLIKKKVIFSFHKDSHHHF